MPKIVLKMLKLVTHLSFKNAEISYASEV